MTREKEGNYLDTLCVKFALDQRWPPTPLTINMGDTLGL